MVTRSGAQDTLVQARGQEPNKYKNVFYSANLEGLASCAVSWAAIVDVTNESRIGS